jgi:hypothetical protein
VAKAFIRKAHTRFSVLNGVLNHPRVIKLPIRLRCLTSQYRHRP